MADRGVEPDRAAELRNRFIGEKDPASLVENSRLCLNATDTLPVTLAPEIERMHLRQPGVPARQLESDGISRTFDVLAGSDAASIATATSSAVLVAVSSRSRGCVVHCWSAPT